MSVDWSKYPPLPKPPKLPEWRDTPEHEAYWEEVEVQDGSRYLYDISEIKPYLFPMYTMTEEQYKTYCELEHSGNMEHLSLPLLEWLNKNHFDYRGLIEKGLAIDATNLNIY